MKLLRVGNEGEEWPALLDPLGQLMDLSGVVADIGGAALLPDSLRTLSQLDTAKLPAIAGAPRIGQCVAHAGKIICVGLNTAVMRPLCCKHKQGRSDAIRKAERFWSAQYANLEPA